MEKSEKTETLKLPYHLGRKKKITSPKYLNSINPELADELYDKIIKILISQKKYKDPDYSMKDLAEELKTNKRYVSTVINSRFGMNYSCLRNEYRVREALHLLVDKRYEKKNIEEIGLMVGFIYRQPFYISFYKLTGMSPRVYREKYKNKQYLHNQPLDKKRTNY